MARKITRTRKTEDVIAAMMDDLVAAHADTHARLGHKGEVDTCVRKIAKHARQLAEANFRPTSQMTFEEFFTRVLKQSVGAGSATPRR